MINVRSDVVGSLLRPPELLAAQKQLADGKINTAAFKEIEDKAVDQAIALQEDAGLEVVTDGKMRRQSFQSQMTEAVEGFGEHSLEAFLRRAIMNPSRLCSSQRLRRSGYCSNTMMLVQAPLNR